MAAPLRIAVVTVQVPFVRGGSEVLAEALCRSLRQAGHQVELIALPFAPHTTEALLDSLAAFRLIELSPEFERVIALKFPAYLLRHPCKVLWLIHQHHGAYERFAGDFGLANLPGGRLAKAAVEEADRLAFSEARALFAISRTVAERLAASHGLAAQVLFPPPLEMEGFYSTDDGGEPRQPRGEPFGEPSGEPFGEPSGEPFGEPYFFFPSRLAPAKRQELALYALALCREPVRLVFAGAPDHQDYGRELAGVAAELGVGERAEFKGFVPDAELRDLYAASRAVLFPPLDEDYGYVTLEAMLSGKPVITCRDSGGTLEFVTDAGAATAGTAAAGVSTGYVCDSEPAALAATLDAVWRDPAEARRRGAAARQNVLALEIGWPATLAALLES